MNRSSAPRSIDEYLKQLREALGDDDPALVQDALYDAEDGLGRVHARVAKALLVTSL